LNDDGMWLIADFENVVPRYKTESRVCRLEVVDGLTHVSFRREYKRREAVVVISHLLSESISIISTLKFHFFLETETTYIFGLANFEESFEDFLISQFGIT